MSYMCHLSAVVMRRGGRRNLSVVGSTSDMGLRPRAKLLREGLSAVILSSLDYT